MPNDVLVNGGARLRAIRKERGYTQEQLAELTKLSTRHIAGIEKGEANPSFEVLYTITRVSTYKEGFKNLRRSNSLRQQRQAVTSFICDIPGKNRSPR